MRSDWPTKVLICMGLLLLCISLCGRFLYADYFIAFPRLLVFWIFPITGLILTALSFKAPPQLKTNLALGLIASSLSLVFLLYAFEAAIQLKAKSIAAQTAPGTGPDKRSKAQIITDLRNDGKTAYPFVYPGTQYKRVIAEGSSSEIHVAGRNIIPLSGISNVLTVYGNPPQYMSDEHGFHNPKGQYTSELQIALIGDSFTHGSSVTSEENIAAVVSSIEPRTLNLGVGGSGPLSELAIIKEYLPHYTPPTVVWLFFEGNDLQDLNREMQVPTLMRYLKEPDFQQDLLTIQSEVDTKLKELAEGYFQIELQKDKQQGQSLLHWKGLLKLYHVRLMARMILKDFNPNYALFDQTLEEAKRTVESWGGELIFVYLPEQARYLPLTMRNLKEQEQRDHVLDLVSRLDLRWVDGVEIFEPHRDDAAQLFSHLDAHYSKKGYGLIAQGIINTLAESDQVTDQPTQTELPKKP